MTALQADVNTTKGAVLNNNNNNNSGANQNDSNDAANPPPRRSRNFRRGRCQQCVENNVFRCTHCLNCGSVDHRRAACPTLNADSSNNLN